MSNYEQIRRAIWNDPDFVRLSRHGKLLYHWLINNPNLTSSGIYHARPEQMALDTGMDGGEVQIALGELAATGMASYDGGQVFVRGRAKHVGSSRGKHDNQRTAIVREVDQVPVGNPHRVAFLARYGGDPWLREHLQPLLDAEKESSLNHGESEGPTQGLIRPPISLSLLSSSERDTDDGRAGASDTSRDELPDGFPPELVATATHVWSRLGEIRTDVCAGRGTRIVVLGRVGRVVRDFDEFSIDAHERVLRNFAFWLETNRRTDLVATYRNFLENECKRSSGAMRRQPAAPSFSRRQAA